MPLALRISRTPRHRAWVRQFAVDLAVSPARIFLRQPADQGLDVSAGGRSCHAWTWRTDDGGTMSRCQRRIVSGVTSSRSPWRRAFGHHAEQGRYECPLRPVQLRAARLPPLQDGEMAQDQNLVDHIFGAAKAASGDAFGHSVAKRRAGENSGHHPGRDVAWAGGVDPDSVAVLEDERAGEGDDGRFRGAAGRRSCGSDEAGNRYKADDCSVSCQERGRAGLGERVHAVEIDLVQDPPGLPVAVGEGGARGLPGIVDQRAKRAAAKFESLLTSAIVVLARLDGAAGSRPLRAGQDAESPIHLLFISYSEGNLYRRCWSRAMGGDYRRRPISTPMSGLSPSWPSRRAVAGRGPR